jgi:hypothetical protein
MRGCYVSQSSTVVGSGMGMTEGNREEVGIKESDNTNISFFDLLCLGQSKNVDLHHPL